MSFRLSTEKLDPREHVPPLIGLWLRKIFLEDWSTKLIALAITLALWFGISGQQTPDTRPYSEVRLNYHVAGDMDISNEPQRQIEITITGDKGKLDRLPRGDLMASVDLSSYNSGERLVQLRPDNVSLELASGNDVPSGIKITDIKPNLLLVKLEKREERAVEVKPEFEGKLPEGFEVYEDQTVVTPATVKVRGPSSFVNSIDTISTETINLDNHSGDFISKQVAINLLNPKITVLDSVVDVSVKVGPKRSERNFTVRTGSAPGPMETFIVTLLGPPQMLEKLSAKDIVIDLVEDPAKPKAKLPDSLSTFVAVKNVKHSGPVLK
jgi:YbbR domain-containing protein